MLVRSSHRMVAGVLLLLLPVLVSCGTDTAIVRDNDAGLNGSFETVREGYPVNWAFFPDPASDTSLTVALDTERVVDGEWSVRLTAAPEHPDRPPGLRSRRHSVESGTTYRVAVSVWTEDASLDVRRVVMDATRTTNKRSDIIATVAPSSGEWLEFEESLTIAEDEAYVMFIGVIHGVGTVWIDDVRVEEVVD